MQRSQSAATVKIDNGARAATNRQIDRPATDRAIFNDRLIRLRSIHFQRKTLAAMRTNDFGPQEEFHWQTSAVEAGVSPANPNRSSRHGCHYSIKARRRVWLQEQQPPPRSFSENAIAERGGHRVAKPLPDNFRS